MLVGVTESSHQVHQAGGQVQGSRAVTILADKYFMKISNKNITAEHCIE